MQANRGAFKNNLPASSGVLLSDALAGCGVSMGVHPRGRSPVEYILIEGADGYVALFSKAELDPIFTESSVLLADRKDGKPLPPEEGPWRVIVPADHLRSRWVRQVRAPELGRIPVPEKRGP